MYGIVWDFTSSNLVPNTDINNKIYESLNQVLAPKENSMKFDGVNKGLIMFTSYEYLSILQLPAQLYSSFKILRYSNQYMLFIIYLY